MVRVPSRTAMPRFMPELPCVKLAGRRNFTTGEAGTPSLQCNNSKSLILPKAKTLNPKPPPPPKAEIKAKTLNPKPPKA